MDQINDLAAFAAVAEARSFSAAARRLQLTTAGVSKSVARLEARLGVRLLTRTTRKVAPTPEGEEFYLRARDILDRLSEAEAEVGAGGAGLEGEVRIAAPVLLGQNVLAPTLAGFRRSHPDIALDIRLSDRVINLTEDGVDLALRLGELSDSRLVARQLARTRFVICGSPGYMARRGTPKTVADLRKHDCVTYVVQGSGRPFAWRLARQQHFTPDRSALVSDGGANCALALAGFGLIQEIDVAIGPALASGALIEVLRQHALAGPPLSLLQPAGRFTPRRVRAVSEYLVAAFGRQPR